MCYFPRKMSLNEICSRLTQCTLAGIARKLRCIHFEFLTKYYSEGGGDWTICPSPGKQCILSPSYFATGFSIARQRKVTQRTVESLPGIKELSFSAQNHSLLKCRTKSFHTVAWPNGAQQTTGARPIKHCRDTRHSRLFGKGPSFGKCQMPSFRRRGRSCEPRDPSQTRGSGRRG